MLKRIRKWMGFDPETYEPPADIPSPDEPRELVLYKFNTCPYCLRVMAVLKETGVDVRLRDTHTEAGARDALHEQTGRTQVPCLVIDDVPFFESRDISQWLLAYAERGAG